MATHLSLVSDSAGDDQPSLDLITEFVLQADVGTPEVVRFMAYLQSSERFAAAPGSIARAPLSASARKNTLAPLGHMGLSPP